MCRSHVDYSELVDSALDLDQLILPISSTAPPSLSQPVASLDVTKQPWGKPTLGQDNILHFAVLKSQYTKVNFSYQSGTFFQYHFLIILVLLSDCAVN